ncbi:MAG TPA: helix-turn-helix domain-containing protein [Acidimicrobiales bacterium]|nr:helix-turn-helix domain-containing protein [Acidimicrobiales bacterium]
MTGAPRLDLLKALGDNTRYAIYLEIARAAMPRSTAAVAESLGLHPNTVRPHLERMRDVGLLEVESQRRGEVGRPQHLWSIAPDAPSLGFEPPAMPMLARMLVGVAAAAGAGPDEAAAIGREQGRAVGAEAAAVVAELDDPDDRAAVCLAALVDELARMGFDPAVAEDGAEVAFARCPFAELAQQHPQLVCHLHRGLIEGFVDAVGGLAVEGFGTLVDRAPCRVALAAR